MKYIYMDKLKASNGEACVLGIYDEHLQEPNKVFGGREWAIWQGEVEDLPHYISLDKDGIHIRPATETEKLKRNQITLARNQVLINDTIVVYEPNTQKVVNNEIVDKTRDDYIAEGKITMDSEKDKARQKRAELFKILDLLDVKVTRGREALTDEEEKQINDWIELWKKVPNEYTDINQPIEKSYPITPEKIKYYMGV